MRRVVPRAAERLSGRPTARTRHRSQGVRSSISCQLARSTPHICSSALARVTPDASGRVEGLNSGVVLGEVRPCRPLCAPSRLRGLSKIAAQTSDFGVQSCDVAHMGRGVYVRDCGWMQELSACRLWNTRTPTLVPMHARRRADARSSELGAGARVCGEPRGGATRAGSIG